MVTGKVLEEMIDCLQRTEVEMTDNFAAAAAEFDSVHAELVLDLTSDGAAVVPVGFA